MKKSTDAFLKVHGRCTTRSQIKNLQEYLLLKRKENKMNITQAKENYKKLFDTDESKANAFDKIAEKYYYANFASTSKADLETLLFSIYIEQILEKDQTDLTAYSDYTLSKLLGISQSKVSNLKVKKELQYPYKKFDWRQSFMCMANRAYYENGTIKLYIPDRNVYLEVKNAIEEAGGYIEVQLTSNLLQVKLAYFLDLMVALSDSQERDEIRKKLKEQIQKADVKEDIKFMERLPLGTVLKNESFDLLKEIIKSCIPYFGNGVCKIAEILYDNTIGR